MTALRLGRLGDVAPQATAVTLEEYRRMEAVAPAPMPAQTPVPDLTSFFADFVERMRPSWMDEAACAGIKGGHWFPERGESVNVARQICSGCPVREQCLAYALDHGEHFGIWGGTSERERRRMRKGRPRTIDRSEPAHGTLRRYRTGCRCDQCRFANTESTNRYRSGRVS